MDAETRYANIERELLAIVFACQRFGMYLLGRSFIAESDHKPLEMIAMKNLANAPPCLQRMLLKLQWYDVTIKYRPGPQMQLADTLSRCPARASPEIKLDMRVDYIAFTKPWIEKLKDSIQRDPILGTVYQLVQQGWPHEWRHMPWLVRRYWDFRDELSMDDGLLLKGPRLNFTRSIWNVYTKAIYLQTRYGRMQGNTSTGLESMLKLKTIPTDARNVSSGLRHPRSPSSLMTYQRAPGGSLVWIIFTLMAIPMS